jgi:valyl-tRNA synthetase
LHGFLARQYDRGRRYRAVFDLGRKNLELSKTFDSKAAEERWFQLWIDRGYFTADPDKPGEAFSIVIPPPNVTGQLHLGHALNVTLQDIIVRTRRMQGFNTLWVPGTDHAGIATQNAVEKDLAKEGKDRHQLGREKFEKRVWEWRETYGNRILNQLRRLGASCDWSRERFTLDEGLSRAVNEVFIRLYQEGLIYKGRKLINWCPRCETALSDLEVDHKEQKNGTLWYFKYPLVDGSGYIEVATTRPETMLGDTAVAVNPEDNRYRYEVGKQARIPLIGREIPIITDSEVDSAFGTGAVKITPAHDFNDFEMGRRHNLPEISIMDTRARMNENAGPYAGLDREAARKRILLDLKAAGLYEKEEKHTNNIGTCSRCDTIVEPMLSEQWFLKVKPMAEKAIAAVRDGRTTFFPKFWENTYFNWMENIHDWCISRQLWWGHRIPAYRCQRCDHLMVVAVRPPKCEECEGTDLKQEDDVLDTWFSSGLWPFSTLGWPATTKEMERYYPTSLLVTGFDIIFFWVARMMMFGLEFTGDVPFRDIYITPLVRDAEGKKMSKSKGNVVDPLELMDTYGTDALRFTLAQLAIQGRDVILSPERLAASRAFANKIWNAARFTMMNLADAPQDAVIPPQGRFPKPEDRTFSETAVPLGWEHDTLVGQVLVPRETLSLADRWILSRLDDTVRDVKNAIDRYEFNVAAMKVYGFIWHEFCDWYIELSKDSLRASGERQETARFVLIRCFDQMLRLLHPFMPFVSEEIWQALRPYMASKQGEPHLAVAQFPEPSSDEPQSGQREWVIRMEDCKEFTEAVNRLRSLLGYHPGQRIRITIGDAPVRMAGAFPGRTEDQYADLVNKANSWIAYAATMTKAESIDFLPYGAPPPAGTVTGILPFCTVYLPAPPDFDFEKARTSVLKDHTEHLAHLKRHVERFQNPEFKNKASSETVSQTAEKIEELGSKVEQLANELRLLGRINK